MLGLLVAVASWGVTFAPPFVGLDESWWAALYMAAHRGLHFGSDLVFTAPVRPGATQRHRVLLRREDG
jgi:hypothetical protein